MRGELRSLFSVSSLYAGNQLIVYAGESSVSGVTERRLRRPRSFKLVSCISIAERERERKKTHQRILQRRAAQLVHYSACGGYY